MKLGAVTIGQAPRNDVAGEFMQALGLEAELLQRGALDGLTLAEIKEIEPKAGDYVLVTRLRDGTEVRIAERHIEERMKACVRKLEEDGAEIIVQFCTGEFPSLTSRKLLLKPDVLLEHLIPAIVGKGCLGAVVPHESQIAAMEKKWGKTGLKVVCTAASPYSGKPADYERAGRELAEKGADLIVLDCIGFTQAMKKIFRAASGRPVILPRTLLGRIAGEMLGGLG
jgi:protein AroM